MLGTRAACSDRCTLKHFRARKRSGRSAEKVAPEVIPREALPGASNDRNSGAVSLAERVTSPAEFEAKGRGAQLV